MRRSLVIVLAAALASAAVVRGQEKEVTVEQVRKAIALFQKDPLAADAKAAGKDILVFAIQSKDVAILVDKEESEWFLDKADENSGHYMVAYMAGNIIAQLNAKKTEPDVYAGLREVLKVYQFVQKQNKDYKRPVLEKYLALEKDGKLQAALADIQKKRIEQMKEAKKLKDT